MRNPCNACLYFAEFGSFCKAFPECYCVVDLDVCDVPVANIYFALPLADADSGSKDGSGCVVEEPVENS